jgi:hypothetical protein
MLKRVFIAVLVGLALGAGCGGGGGNGGGSGPDTTAPEITSGPEVYGIDDQGATVGWTTDEAATSIVRYGETDSYSDSVVSYSYVTIHSARIDGLGSGMLYHYRIYSADEAGNMTSSADRTFTTLTPVGKFVGEGWDFFEDAEYDSSLARFTEAADYEPDNVDVLEGLAWNHLYAYRFTDCRSVLETALAEEPGRLDCLVAAALLYQALDEFDLAIEKAGSALELAGSAYSFSHDPGVTDEDVRFSLIVALAAKGDFEGALEEALVLDPGIDLDPGDPGTWGGLSTFEEAMLALIEDLRNLAWSPPAL